MIEVQGVRIKHYITLRIINHKNRNHFVNNDFANTFLAAEKWSMTLAGSPQF